MIRNIFPLGGKSEDINSRLICAAYQGNVDLVKSLLAAGADVNIKNQEGDTALILAAMKGHDEVVMVLIDAGADVNIKSNHGLTALSVSEWYGHTEISRLLRDTGTVEDRGIEDNAILTCETLEDFDRGKFTCQPQGPPLDKKKGSSLVKKFFSRIQGRRSKNERFLKAVQEGEITAVKILMAEGSDVNTVQQPDRITPLMYAANKGYTEIVALLITLGANINAQDSKGRTALIYATIRGQAEMVRILIDYKANLSIKDTLGNTALHWAVSFNHTQIVEILKSAGASLSKHPPVSQKF